MTQTAPNPTELFNELFATVEQIGVEKTRKTLQEARSSSLISSMDIDFILQTVAIVTTTTVEQILRGVERTDERKASVSLAVYFIKKELNYSYSEIKRILEKDESAICRYFNLVKSVQKKKPCTKFEQNILVYTKKIESLIMQKHKQKQTKAA